MPLTDAVALLVPQHLNEAGDVWTFFVRDGVLEMTVERAPEAVSGAQSQT